ARPASGADRAEREAGPQARRRRVVAADHPAIEVETATGDAGALPAHAQRLAPGAGGVAGTHPLDPRRQRTAADVDRVEGQAGGQRVRFAGQAVERGRGSAFVRTSWPSVIRSTVTVWPSRGKLSGATEVVSWPRSPIPACATASRTVAALVRMVRARPSAMTVTERSVRTSRVSPSRPIRREREVDRYAPSARTPSCLSAPSTVSAVVQTRVRRPSRVSTRGLAWRTSTRSPWPSPVPGAGVTASC